MADVKRFYQFNSLQELRDAMGEMPYPSIARIHDSNDLFVFYRHDRNTKPDTMYTVSTSRFIVGNSCLGGRSTLGAEIHAEQATVPSII